MANDPRVELQDTTHTYVARAWYRDSQTWVLIVTLAATFLRDDLLNDPEFKALLPDRVVHLLVKLMLFVALVLRATSATRPIGMTAGTTREVRSITPKVNP